LLIPRQGYLHFSAVPESPGISFLTPKTVAIVPQSLFRVNVKKIIINEGISVVGCC
jgi:hypothetical protein